MKNTHAAPLFFWGMLSLYFLFLFFQVLSSDYLLSDEAYLLWNQADHHTMFAMWDPQGRALSGLFFQWELEKAGTVTNMRYVRLVSCSGWVLCVLLLFFILKRLQGAQGIVLSDWTIYLTTAFMASSLFGNIYTGWAACGEIFIPVLLSLTAGTLLFEAVQKTGGSVAAVFRRRILSLPAVTVLGVIALFFYQTVYPFLLLPFYCLFLNHKDGRFTRPMVTGIFFFFLVLGLYYLLFRYSLHVMNVPETGRSELKFNPLNRLSFFFSYPLNQAFNYIFFFDTHSTWSQAVFPGVFTAWILWVFLSRKREPMKNLLYLAGMIGWWIMGYLPQLIAQESFGGYRSMAVLGVMVFMMTTETLLPKMKEGAGKQALGFALTLLMLVYGGHVYYAYLSHPLREEYRVVREEIRKHYNNRIKKMVVIRPSEDGFSKSFGVMHFKDEFGMPSLYKGWVAEPMMKQIVYEMTGNRREADSLKVTLDSLLSPNPRVLLLDIQHLIDTKTIH